MRRPRVVRECRLGAVAGRVGCVSSAAASLRAGESSCAGARRREVVWYGRSRGALVRCVVVFGAPPARSLARLAGERLVGSGVVSHPAGRVVWSRVAEAECRACRGSSVRSLVRVRAGARVGVLSVWLGRRFVAGYLVDPASSHMLVSKIKPCMSKYKRLVL